jgi:hypothetical protein
MKQAHVPLKTNSEQPKAVLRKLSFLEARTKKKKQGNKQLRIVQSVNAGRVRGGHSFH